MSPTRPLCPGKESSFLTPTCSSGSGLDSVSMTEEVLNLKGIDKGVGKMSRKTGSKGITILTLPF